MPCSSFRLESFDSVVFIQFAPAIDSINASRFVASDLGPATDSCYYVHDSLRLPSPQLLRAGQASETGGGGHFRHHGRTSWANDRHPADLAGQVASVPFRTILFLAFVVFFTHMFGNHCFSFQNVSTDCRRSFPLCHIHVVIQGTKGRHRSATLGTLLGYSLDAPVCFLSFCGTECMTWWTIKLPGEVVHWLGKIQKHTQRVLAGPILPGQPQQIQEIHDDSESDSPVEDKEDTPRPPSVPGAVGSRPKAKARPRQDEPSGPEKKKQKSDSHVSGPKRPGLGLIMQPGDCGWTPEGTRVEVDQDGQIPVPDTPDHSGTSDEEVRAADKRCEYRFKSLSLVTWM